MRNNFHQIYPNQRWPEPRFSFTKTLADGPRSYYLNNDLVNIYIKMKYLFCQFIEGCFYTALCCNYQFPKNAFLALLLPIYNTLQFVIPTSEHIWYIVQKSLFCASYFHFLSHCYNFISFKETMTVIDQGPLLNDKKTGVFTLFGVKLQFIWHIKTLLSQ